MALPNTTVNVTPGSGVAMAAHDVGNVKHQGVVLVEPDGHMAGSKAAYLYISPPIAAGASKLLVDLFNATGSGRVLEVTGVYVIPKLDVAVTGAVAVRVDLYRTSAVGTGGTVASTESATIDVAGGNICRVDELSAALPAQVTARVAPTGGATISRWLTTFNVATEEAATSQGYVSQRVNIIPGDRGLVVREGSGLLIKQGSVASVGSVSIAIAFTGA